MLKSSKSVQSATFTGMPSVLLSEAVNVMSPALSEPVTVIASNSATNAANPRMMMSTMVSESRPPPPVILSTVPVPTGAAKLVVSKVPLALRSCSWPAAGPASRIASSSLSSARANSTPAPGSLSATIGSMPAYSTRVAPNCISAARAVHRAAS